MNRRRQDTDPGWFWPGLVCGVIIGVLAAHVARQVVSQETNHAQEPPELWLPGQASLAKDRQHVLRDVAAFVDLHDSFKASAIAGDHKTAKAIGADIL